MLLLKIHINRDVLLMISEYSPYPKHSVSLTTPPPPRTLEAELVSALILCMCGLFAVNKD